MICSFKGSYDIIKAFSEIDLTEDVKEVNIPTLVLHGDDDQVVQIEASAKPAIRSLPNGTLKVYPERSHTLPNISMDEVNLDLLGFLKNSK
jgi:non-heme chloroperoxidase